MIKLSIKEWALEDRPREKMLRLGVSSLSDAELLAILIGSGNDNESAVQLSQRILHSVDNNLNALGKVPIQELSKGFKGIGMVKAITIAAAMELGRRRSVSDVPEMIQINSSLDAQRLFYPLLCDLKHEEFWIALTNRAGKVMEKVKICQGGITQISVDIRLIFKAAINSLATGIILCHNHPSGNTKPGTDDDNLTRRVKQAATLLGFNLLDHIIISDNKYYSYADENKIV